MNNSFKSAKIALVISIIAIIFTSMNLINLSVKGLPMEGAVALFCAALAVLYGNTMNYRKQKKKK